VACGSDAVRRAGRLGSAGATFAGAKGDDVDKAAVIASPASL